MGDRKMMRKKQIDDQYLCGVKREIRLRLLMVLASTALAAVLLCGGCGTATQEEKEAIKAEGIAAMEAGDYETAVDKFDEVLAMSGGTVNAHVVDTCYYKAAALYAQGNLQEAIDVYSSVIAYDEEDPQPCFLRGCIYLNEGEKEKALKDYQEAAKRCDGDYEMYLLIYRNLAASGDKADGMDFVNEALAMTGNSGEDALGKGRIYLELKDYPNAIEQMTKAADKGVAEAKVYLAQAYEQSGDSEKATEILASYVKEDDPSAEALALLGNMELASGHYEEALTYYQKGLEMSEEDAQQDLLKGEIAALEYLGRFSEAKTKMQDYIATYPTDQAAQHEWIFLQTR